MTFNEKLKTMDLVEIKEKLDEIEKDMYTHGYRLDSEGVDFYCKEICLFNMLVHKEIGIPYESEYQYGEPYGDGDVTFDEKLKTMDLMEIKEKLDAREQNMEKHGYKLDSEEIDFYCKEICLFNMLVHKEIGIPYESQYQYGEPYEDC